jgi:hypothetical protein
MANVDSWSFDKATQSFSVQNATGDISKPKNAGKNLSLTSSNGVHLTVSSFADTKQVAGGGNTIQRSKLTWASDTSLGVKNKAEKTRGESWGDNSGYLKKANRGIDSVATQGKQTGGNFDMILLEFDTAVSLDGLTLEWARGGNAAKKTADISVLAYTGDGSFDLKKNTWAGVLGSGNGNAFDTVGNYTNVGLSYFAVNPAYVTSTKWLIGVYNPVFGSGGDAGDDAFRLASIETSGQIENTFMLSAIEPQDVPSPGTPLLLLAGWLAFAARSFGRRRKTLVATKAVATDSQ